MLKWANGVHETTETTGTGAIALAGAAAGSSAFGDVLEDGDKFGYAILNGVDFERGIGTYNASTDTISRTTVKSSSNGGAKVNWTSGTKDVILALLAEIIVTIDENGQVTTPADIVISDHYVQIGSSSPAEYYRVKMDASGHLLIALASRTPNVNVLDFQLDHFAPGDHRLALPKIYSPQVEGDVIKLGGTALASAATKTAGGAAGNVPVLDSGGKLVVGVLPAPTVPDASNPGKAGAWPAAPAGLAVRFLGSDLAWYTRYAPYVSAWITGWAIGTAPTPVDHGLGAEPDRLVLELNCMTAEYGYAVGDTIAKMDDSNETSGGSNAGLGLYKNATKVGYVIGKAGIRIHRRDATHEGEHTYVTPANWRLRLIAERRIG
ncbi:hypothetical protein GC209_19260 [bacterium]|nr:hypothetical protein [bacterium]